MLSFEDARRKVIEVTVGLGKTPAPENLPLESALGRILAEEILADRDYPPFDRATRDGFAVRSTDCAQPNARLRILGEIPAGSEFPGIVQANECVRIMTGAGLPRGADAVVMVEHTRRGENEDTVVIERVAERGMNFVGKGSEARAQASLLGVGQRLGYAELAIAAQAGRLQPRVNRKPRVAVLSTGNEVVPVDASPNAFEIRNSNGVSLVAQVRLAGGEPVPLGNAPDTVETLHEKIVLGLREDILVLSGGVSMGKYDLVEDVLRGMGARFYFDAVAIRPGRPAVFALCRDKPVFGLPGNPVSTMVTFELLVCPAIEILGGSQAQDLPFLKARLGESIEEKPGMTHFLPARVAWPNREATVSKLPWQGSGDIVALARSNCFLVVPGAMNRLQAGEWVDVLPRRGML